MSGRRRGFTLTEMLCALLIIAAVWVCLLPVAARAKESARLARCGWQLRQIGQALQIYGRDHAGHLPPEAAGLEALVPRYLPVPETLVCPTAVWKAQGWGAEFSEQKLELGYRYRGGLCDDDWPQWAVAADPVGRHLGCVNMLFLDGHVRRLENAAAERAWAKMEGGR